MKTSMSGSANGSLAERWCLGICLLGAVGTQIGCTILRGGDETWGATTLCVPTVYIN